jgi:hypothetical protein
MSCRPLYLSIAFAVSAALHAEVISKNITGLGGSIRLGQSLITPDGGPWNNISFNFISGTPSSGDTPFAFGPLFLLTEEFPGLIPFDVTTPGFLASTFTIIDGRWHFDSSLLLHPNTKYWFYMAETDLIATLRGGDDVVEGDGYFGLAGIPQFSKFLDLDFRETGRDTYFTLQGDAIAPVPEPNQVLLLALCLLFCFWVPGRAIHSRRNRR